MPNIDEQKELVEQLKSKLVVLDSLVDKVYIGINVINVMSKFDIWMSSFHNNRHNTVWEYTK